jgi:hypothetical protein
MPEEKDKIKKLYDTFVSDGYDMESEEDFRKNLLDSTKRKAAYDALVKDGYDMEPFEEFESNIGFGKKQASSQQSESSIDGMVEDPISPANEQIWQPTEKEKVAMLTGTDRIMNNVKAHTQAFNERMDNMQEYGINPGLQTKEGKMIFNPESGKLEKTFLTPAGNRYYSKPSADMESFQYRQAADMSIGGQLRKANLRLQDLKAKQAERASEVHKEWAEETENNKAPLAAILGAATYTPRQQSDKENRALSVAIRETEELIKNLEEQKDRENGVDVGFWRGFGRTMGDVRTWDFGMGDMRDALTMINADDLKGKNATEGEHEAHDAMMGAIHEKQQAEERYGGNADFWNRAGVMAGYMPSFMLDFVLTGGGFNGLSSFSKGSTRLATKVIGKETAEKMAQQGFKSYIKENGAKGLGRYATDWTIKALGTTADDLLVRAPLMANTVQAGKTTTDIIDRKLGDVVVDENGNYDFSNDKTWGDAIWQSEANAIIENYSEMFGAHLDPVFTLGNMNKLANVVGAKRIGAVLSKADASALNGIMGQTHQMFNKMGVSDYVGEVSEEYYGQLWRTMLNLDDAYQQNPDGTRTNLFASGQFHGDIWGGMALSMGLMGAGKHTLSAANYASMKHGVNKADAKVNELLGKEVWEPLKAMLDLTTNENIGEVAELIAGDKDFTINEKAAVLDYMERSLNLRGFNLASMAQSRGGNRNESVQQANDSYLDGYNIISSQEMNDAKNMYEYQRGRVADLVDESMFAMIEENPIAALEFVNGNGQWNDEDKSSVIDYINAKQVYNGMIQRVRDDIDGRIEQSNSMIDARVNRNTGMIQGATMKQDKRKVYVISGKLVPYDDGSGVSVTDSDNSIIIRDSETGVLEQVSPDAVLSLDESQDPNEQKELAEQAIVEQFAREAADKIDGKITFNPGDAYTITGEDGSQIQVQVIANEDGIVDNGDGTVNVSDGVNIFPLAKETIQQQADAANLARVAQFEQQRTIENAERKQEMQEAERPQYALNDIVSLTDENGVTVRGNITADADADGRYEVFTEAPINGKRVNLFTRDELDNMLLEHNGVAFERPAENESNNGAENIPENDNNAPQNIPAMQRIPKDEQGNPLYEQTDSDTAWDAIVEQTEGDEVMAQTVADGMVVDKEEALKKLEKAKSKGGNSIAEKIASEKERKAAIDAAKQELLVWQKIAGTANRRKMEADAERRRIADEAAALRKAEEEKLRVEREEAERIEREALNGVPDMVDDKPQDARARGYRRVNGHKVDRQEPIQALHGKDVSVKFSDDVLVGGRAAVIDANQLQPSHIQGVRNPLHFIDEAQPKERNDEASLLSSRKIAGNIRPEEITSSVTAYTGAPTVNARGEVIQGNNRSDALRQMWAAHSEQAETYKQYLKDHADEFGLQAEDIDGMKHPVLVNMVDVDDAEAINLGQYVAQDTESGGIERIKPKNIMQKMGNDMRSFANLLLASSDEEISFAGLVDANGTNVLKWMMQKGYITPTQYSSAFDSKGNLTAEAKNDLRGIMYQSIFKGGSVRLEEMFNALPVKAQKAILATAFRDYDSPSAERMAQEIQNSIRAYYALSQDKLFTEAKNFKEARMAVESWKRQYQIDDATGESYLPADNFSNFALLLAAMYKGSSQGFMQGMFAEIYDLVQGTQETTLFEEPDNTPRTLAEAINEAVNKRNELLYENEKFEYDGQRRSDVLAGGSAQSQRGQQGSRGDNQTGKRTENGNWAADSGRRIEESDEQRSTIGGNNKRIEADSESKQARYTLSEKKSGNGEYFYQDENGNIDLADIPQEVFDEIGYTKAPFRLTPGMMLHMIERHGKELGISSTDEAVSFVLDVMNNFDHVRLGYDGALIFSIENGRKRTGKRAITILINSDNGKFYGLKTSGYESIGGLNKRPMLWERGAKDVSSSTDAASASVPTGKSPLSGEQSGSASHQSTGLLEGSVIWRTPKDATTSSVERQGLDYEQSIKTETATKDSGITPQSTSSDSKGTNNSVKSSELGEKIAAAEAEVNVNPTEAQKEAGNYKKGHVQVGVFDITIEQPKGSVRSGVDANGNKWETTMQNTYGYIRGTEGVDGDHIDVFLSDDIDGWNGRRVFVVDQYNEDGSFDEHKVMLGFNETDDAEAAYFANYDSDWAKKHKTVLTAVNLEDFEKWIDSSHRKTKAFAEYKSVKTKQEYKAFNDLLRDSDTAHPPYEGDVKMLLRLANKVLANGIKSIEYGLEEVTGSVSVNSSDKSKLDKYYYSNRNHTESGIDYSAYKGNISIVDEDNQTVYNFSYEPPQYKGKDAKLYVNVARIVGEEETTESIDAPYTITPAQYTTKRGKVLDMQIVKFGMELSKDEFRSANAFAKSLKGWYDAKQRGFLMRSEDDAKQLVDAVIPKEDAALSVTQSEDSENAVENTPQVGEDIFQMAERIAKEEEEKRRASKENARKVEEAGEEPVSLEHWKRMDGDARMAEVGKRPLTREEIESASTDEVLKANALDYLDGNQGMIQSISYLKVYEDVRYPNRTAAADSGATDSAQLDTPALGNEQRVDVRDREQSGNSNARLDRETGEEGVPSEGEPLHADPSDARSDATGNGNGGSETLPVRESVLQLGDSRGDVHSGSSVRSGEGRNVGGRTGRKSSTTSRKNSKRGVQADTARNAKNDRGLDLNDPLNKELANALKEFDSVLDEFNRAGREELSMSLVGMNSRQMEVLPWLVSAGAKVGYAYIKKGAHNFAEWAKRMREALGSKLKDAGLGENEIDAFIKEMWKSKLPMDGETHTVEEWASIMGKAELRKKIGGTIEEKRKAQQAAEPIPVKTCDRENIAQTLPFLLPQQQDDVLKAETQFFDESHNDRDHAFGKGYMFTNGTGTGKTYTGLGIVKRFIKQGKGRILILTPSQTKVKDWIEDAANLDIELNDLDKTAKARKDGTTAITEKGEGAVITTYANFRQNKALLEDLFDLIVYDESHRLLENKGGVGTTGSMQHYKLSNRNEQFAFLRLQDNNPTWNELNAKNEEFSTQRDAIIKRIEKESGTTNELTLEQRGELPPVFNGNWTQGMEQKFPELAKLRNECLSLDAKYAKEVKPELERQAKENVKHTKVVFLSATPFNTRENLDYVEGYIFSYPEKEKQDGYSTQSPRSQFYLEHFGAGYKWRYHRLESSGSNPEAVSKQEVEFSNYLQHTLQTMSGRIIDSPFDYSRDFPTVTLDKAEEFNNAMEELSRNKATSYAYHEVMGDYNYTSALFESMKVTQIIPRLEEHFARGRKAVIFHRRVESKNPLVPPFKTIFDVAVQSLKEEYDATKKAENKKEIARLRRKYAGMLEWEQTLDLRMPREQLADAFGKNNVLFFSGKESKKIKDKAVEDFNNDVSGKNVIVIQEDSGKEGISLHDTTGQHQRVLVTLALPQSPITALQIEGRIYRIGNKSNAIFEYPLLGLNTELMLFGQKFNQQVSTTENLALGSQARNLRESFARGVEEHSGNVDIDNQGVGGKEFDTPSHTETDAFDGTVLDYYTNQKLTGKRDSREGTDYYPTPEPLGFMMNQWGRIGEGESVLEPSAGHGAIARYVPRENPLTAIEPSQSLFSKLQIKAGGNGRKFENTVFEDYNVVNKHDVVLMNPPFGAGGRLAVDHVAKAFQHLEEGGRIVAIIPRGSTDKKFDKWYEEQKDAVLTAEIGLPDITFERAGTSVNCRVVVIDKVTNEILRQDAAFRAVHMDLSGDHYEKIEDFFEEIRNIDVPERTIDHKAKLKKKAAPTARELRTIKGINYVNLTEDGISVSGRGVWGGLEWKDKTGKALTDYLADQYRRFKSNYDYAVRDGRETQEAAYGEMKELACKLAGMTEDEMQRYIDKKSGDNMLYRSDELIESINEQFNEELQQQIDGTLPKGHIYQLGNPGNVLLGTGVPNLPIQLNSTRLIDKATRFGHNYGLEEIKDLVVALQSPIAVFAYGDKSKGQNIIVELSSNDKNFVVGMSLNPTVGGKTLEINSIRNVFPKDNAEWLNWITQEKLLYVDKERIQNLIDQQRTILADVDYLDLDSVTKIVESFENPSVERENLREGDGAYTDDEVGFENDPVAKLLGQSRRTAKQRRKFAQRERQRMAERVESLAKKLHLDNVEVVTDASVLDGRKQRAKGFYSKSTGKIAIVIPNHASTFDVEQTLLHEAVAHYGLRQLFGEHFDTFLNNVFDNAEESIRRRIMDIRKKLYRQYVQKAVEGVTSVFEQAEIIANLPKTESDFTHTATEEYLAGLAENTNFENINASWWQQIKDFFLNMLHKIGFEDFRGVTLSDNELRYILWRSYENLAEPGRYRNILGEAADVAKQYELKVGNYAVSDPHHQTVAESDDALYRTGDPEIHERELARDRYERRVKSGMFQSQEALQDSMLGLKEAMTAILGKETNIEDVDGFENAYLGENRLSSVNKAEADAFAHTLFKPMLDEVAKLARTEAEREELTDYMMAKHGLERNTYMRNEAINNGATDADQTDYAGLTALTGMDNVTDAETEAHIMVNDYEQAHDTTDLWKKINAASKAILSKSYECGMMSKATFDKISDMYDFYIPLRGFDEKTSSETYAYLTHKQSALNAPIKKAEGRRSKADDPFANLQSMAEGAIMQGNRNKLVKQRFLNFALNHPSDLVSVSDIWVEYDTVADEWKPVFPDNIDSTDTPEVVERKMLDFETKMESLAQQYPDRYKHGKDTVNIPYRIVESQDMRQHQIVVKRGGRDYVITINGNPRAAQALNGQTNPDNDMSGAIGAILRAGENINRQLSAFYTTRNPDFIVSNFMRDMLYTNTMTWIRESPNYALRFHRNYMYANPVRIKQLLAKHRKGTLDMSNKTEAMFHQFMMNGGETGYANIRDIEQHKNDIRRELKKSNGKIPVKKAWDLLGERFDEYNRAVENCARFAAFMTSREMGRSIDRAIYDAKEISINFNKKGSGAKFYDSTGQTKAGNASALVSGLGRSGYVFWNAAIQGTANFGRQMKRHPSKAFTGIAAMFLLGAIVAYLGGDDDDDDDKNAYYNLPEYVRRSNILFKAGNSWVSIPLPVEYRAVYGMGELMISVLNGKEHLTGEEIAEAITGQATQILPIDFLEGGGGLNAFVPSAYKPLWEAYVAEKSWTGMPLYKDTPYNKDMPEWTKAYKSANKYIVGLANAMNEATGGDPYTKGTIDFNPAKVEYLLNGYFGGVFGTIDKMAKTAETISGAREYDPRSILLVNRLVKAGDERTEYRAVNNEYFRLKEEHDRLKTRLKHYEEDTENDIFDYAEKIDFLYNSPEYERYEIFEDYRRDIDDLYNELNDVVDDEERKSIESELNELKKEMIEEMNRTRKRK